MIKSILIGFSAIVCFLILMTLTGGIFNYLMDRPFFFAAPALTGMGFWIIAVSFVTACYLIGYHIRDWWEGF